jgi:DNA-binding NarL/FixJ family response regulator
MAVRVILCDDHAMVREGLARLVSTHEAIDVVGLASDGEEAVELTLRLEPDVVMMDISMPRVDGIEATRRIIAEAPSTRIIMLTSFREDEQVLEALGAGAIGFMLKDSDGRELVRGIEAAARGEAPLDPRAATALVRRPKISDPREGMSERERQVLDLISSGLPNKAIASQLEITEATVKAHLTRIYRQIGVTDRTQAAIWARDNPHRGRRP